MYLDLSRQTQPPLSDGRTALNESTRRITRQKVERARSTPLPRGPHQHVWSRSDVGHTPPRATSSSESCRPAGRVGTFSLDRRTSWGGASRSWRPCGYHDYKSTNDGNNRHYWKTGEVGCFPVYDTSLPRYVVSLTIPGPTGFIYPSSPLRIISLIPVDTSAEGKGVKGTTQNIRLPGKSNTCLSHYFIWRTNTKTHLS